MRTSGVARRPEGVLRATGDSSSFFFFFARSSMSHGTTLHGTIHPVTT